MPKESVSERFRQDASGVVAVLVTGTWLALLMLGVPNSIWLAVMLFGYVALVPLTAMLFEEEGEAETVEEELEAMFGGDSGSTAENRTDAEEALQRLRRRYADGELTDEQFEKKLERLLETETLEAAKDRVARRQSRSRDSEREAELE